MFSNELALTDYRIDYSYADEESRVNIFSNKHGNAGDHSF